MAIHNKKQSYKINQLLLKANYLGKPLDLSYQWFRFL